LSDRHVLFSIDVHEDDSELYYYGDAVVSYLENFDKTYGVETSTLGRSGRHICIECNAQNFINSGELISAYEDLENESKALSLDVAPIYESTAIEINKKLSDELEECKTRYAELLEENDALQKKIEEFRILQLSCPNCVRISCAKQITPNRATAETAAA
jgi:hypothetical protein